VVLSPGKPRRPYKPTFQSLAELETRGRKLPLLLKGRAKKTDGGPTFHSHMKNRWKARRSKHTDNKQHGHSRQRLIRGRARRAAASQSSNSSRTNTRRGDDGNIQDNEDGVRSDPDGVLGEVESLTSCGCAAAAGVLLARQWAAVHRASEGRERVGSHGET
jgi:hypothetical protein